MNIPPDRTALAGIVCDEDPMGTDGFEFVEFTRPDLPGLEAVFNRLGFVQVAVHCSKRVTLWRQGQVNFILNAEPESFAQVSAGCTAPTPVPWPSAWPTPRRPSRARCSLAPARFKAVSGQWS